MIYFILGIIVGLLIALIQVNKEKVAIEIKKFTKTNRATVVDLSPDVDLGNEEEN